MNATTVADDMIPSRVALVGTPNSGKTALFNRLTGSRQKVANYPGVTVERKSGPLALGSGARLQLFDLPGTYSLRGRSPDEVVTRDVILGRRDTVALPDALACIVDATNLRVALRLVLELKRLGRPMLLVLNMSDIAKRRGVIIDEARLASELGMPTVASVAVRKDGVAALLKALEAFTAGHGANVVADWSAPTAAELRTLQREADRILAVAVSAAPKPDTLTTRLDAVLLHPVAGLVILLGMLFIMFQAVFTGAKPLMEVISGGFEALGGLVAAWLPPGLLLSFLQEGVIAGVGSVIVFLPQIMILFLFILVLEDFGYMARAAFLMDRIMGGAGLHGRAFIPLLSSFACAIPGIMATRVIDQRRDRLTTIMVAPLMTCSARIPVYTLIISAFIPSREVWGLFNMQGLVMFGLYATGIASALLVSFVSNHMLWNENPTPPFMLELPDYKLPGLASIALSLWQRVKAFLHRAGTTIFSMMVLIWFLASFPRPPEGAEHPAIDYSLAAGLGRLVEPVLAPLGFNWQIAVALIPGMAAREVSVAALGTVYAVAGGKEASEQIGQILARQWSLPTGLAFLAWFIFAPQCVSTLAVIRRETGGWQWMLIAFTYMLGLAYLAALVTFQVGSRIL